MLKFLSIFFLLYSASVFGNTDIETVIQNYETVIQNHGISSQNYKKVIQDYGKARQAYEKAKWAYEKAELALKLTKEWQVYSNGSLEASYYMNNEAYKKARQENEEKNFPAIKDRIEWWDFLKANHDYMIAKLALEEAIERWELLLDEMQADEEYITNRYYQYD